MKADVWCRPEEEEISLSLTHHLITFGRDQNPEDTGPATGRALPPGLLGGLVTYGSSVLLRTDGGRDVRVARTQDCTITTVETYHKKRYNHECEHSVWDLKNSAEQSFGSE